SGRAAALYLSEREAAAALRGGLAARAAVAGDGDGTAELRANGVQRERGRAAGQGEARRSAGRTKRRHARAGEGDSAIRLAAAEVARLLGGARDEVLGLARGGAEASAEGERIRDVARQ